MSSSENKSLLIVIIVGFLILLLLYHYWKNCHNIVKPPVKPKPSVKPLAISNTNKVVLEIYHMLNCPHCEDIVKNKQSNGKTKLDEIKDIFKNDNNVEILTFQHGKDKKADKFNAFPVILINDEQYEGSREVDAIIKTIQSKSS
jgi:protein-disulfide isomerase